MRGGYVLEAQLNSKLLDFETTLWSALFSTIWNDIRYSETTVYISTSKTALTGGDEEAENGGDAEGTKNKTSEMWGICLQPLPIHNVFNHLSRIVILSR